MFGKQIFIVRATMKTTLVFLVVMSVFAALSDCQDSTNKLDERKPKVGYINPARYYQPSFYQPGGYFQYVNVPSWKEYEFGWNRGSPYHYMSRYEQGKDHRFRTRVRWGDKRGGYGEHYWEFNHGPSYHQQHQQKQRVHNQRDEVQPEHYNEVERRPTVYITPKPSNILTVEKPR